MSRLLIVAHEDLALGFRLAGVEAYSVEDALSAQALVSSWLDDGVQGLLAIEGELLAKMDAAFIERLNAADHLPHLSIPSGELFATGPSRRQRIAELIRRAIGFQITLKGEEGEVTQR